MADFEQRYFLKPDAVSKHLYCSICQDVFNEPQRAPCGHSFCKLCIQQWLKQSKTCPEDRRPVQMKDLHYDFILANIIGDQIVACPYRPKGCEYVDKLETLNFHKKSCTFNPENLPEFMRDNNRKDESLGETARLCNITNDSFDETNDRLPTPAKPSLKMRLFCDKNKRSLLCSVFDNKENKNGNESNINKWIDKGNHVAPKKRQRTRALLDDSF